MKRIYFYSLACIFLCPNLGAAEKDPIPYREPLAPSILTHYGLRHTFLAKDMPKSEFMHCTAKALCRDVVQDKIAPFTDDRLLHDPLDLTNLSLDLFRN